MIRSRQPRPAISPALRTLPLQPYSYTNPPILCLSPLPASPKSTHPTQLDTPVPPQPLCYQSYPHAFRHTWGCHSVSTLQLQCPQCLRPRFAVHTRFVMTGLPRTPTKVLLSGLRFAGRDGTVDRMLAMLQQTGQPRQATKLTETASANRMKRVRPPKAVPQRIGCR